MTAYNFKAQFAPLVEAGTKRQTIRRNGKKRRPRVGAAVALYTGQRTKQCRLLRHGVITEVADIILDLVDGIVWLSFADDAKPANRAQRDSLARDDGFADWEAMRAWFMQEYGRVMIHGYVIKWE